MVTGRESGPFHFSLSPSRTDLEIYDRRDAERGGLPHERADSFGLSFATDTDTDLVVHLYHRQDAFPPARQHSSLCLTGSRPLDKIVQALTGIGSAQLCHRPGMILVGHTTFRLRP